MSQLDFLFIYVSKLVKYILLFNFNLLSPEGNLKDYKIILIVNRAILYILSVSLPLPNWYKIHTSFDKLDQRHTLIIALEKSKFDVEED